MAFGDRPLFDPEGANNSIFGGGNFVNSLFQSPLLLGGAGLAFGGFPGLGLGLITARDAAEAQRLAEQDEAFLQQSRDENDRITAELERVASLSPTFLRDGQLFGAGVDTAAGRRFTAGGGTDRFAPGKAGAIPNLINLEGSFGEGQAALGGFLGNLPSLEDRTISFNPVQEFTPGGLFQQIEGLGVLPETNLSDVLGSRLAGIGAASQGREQLRRQEVAALASQFGGLENLRGQLGNVGFQEGALRGLEGSQAIGQTRAEELAAQQFVSSLAGGLSTTEAQLNNAIRQFNESLGVGVQESNIGRELGIANIMAQLESGAAGDETRAQAFMADAILKSLGFEGGTLQAAGQLDLSGLAAQVPLLTRGINLGSFLPNIFPGHFNPSGGGSDSGGGFSLDLTSILGGVGALGAGAAGASTIGTIAGGKMLFGCIDGEAWIDGPVEKTRLKDVQIGDQVFDSEGNTTEVIDKDFGLPHKEREDDFIRISSDFIELTCTRDHPIDGIPAGDLQIGDRVGQLIIRSVVKSRPVPCGDLQLENGGGYIANGFAVDSMLEKLKAEN